MFDTSPVSVSVDEVGDVTGTKFEGVFRFKPILTHAEQLMRDQIMRDLLGPTPKEASLRAVSQAGIIAEIKIRTVESPSWWKDSRDGLALYDESIIAVIYDRIMEVESKWKEDVKKKAADAKVKLTETK